MSMSKVVIQLPNLENAQVTQLIALPLAHALLGELTYQNEKANFLKMKVKWFIDVLIVQTWHRYQKGLLWKAKQMKIDKLALKEEWKGEWVFTVHAHYQDQKSIEELKTQQKTLEAILAAAQNDRGKQDEVDTPPSCFENITSKDAAIMMKLPEGKKFDFTWKEGMEDLSELLKNKLWTCLELKDTKVPPFFQDYTTPDSAIDPWTEEGEKWLASKSSAWDIYCDHDGISSLESIEC
ncbi:hypothetical protein OG21DRAFT_1527074 [Imleria badia]|nr:hypothetical protein OG21DRAFT_1527074 [Imleria badia]